MGLRTLAQFRDSLEFNLGNRGLGKDQLNLWINDGLLDITSSVDFRALEDKIELTFNGSSSAPIPDNVVNVRFVQDISSHRLLTPLPEVEMLRRPLGVPSHWSRFGNTIRVNSVIFDSENPQLHAYVRIEHPLLEGDTDTTVLPQMWDIAVAYLATHHGFLSLGEGELSVVWLSRAINYIQTRMTDEDLESSLSGTAMVNASGMRALMARLQNLQNSEV